MDKPTLKQYADLTELDFAQHPVWLCVHGIDEKEPWYGQTNEVTYRPWDRPLPYDRLDSNRPTVVVRADFSFADGTASVGLLTPPVGDGSYGDSPSYTQPQVFVPGDGAIALYEPVRRLAIRAAERLRGWLHRDVQEIFPIRYTVPATLVTPPLAGELKGIYYLNNGREQVLAGQD